MPKLDAETLREVKGDLVERLTDQQRLAGVLPNPEAAEAFVAPILRKVEVDAELERQRAIVRAEAGISENDLHDGGDRKVLPSGRVRGRALPAARPGSKASVSRFAVDMSEEMRQQAQLATLQRMMIKHLLELPDWKPRILKAIRMCGKHDGTIKAADQSCVECSMRERKLKEIIGQAVRYFGDPRTPPTPKAFSIPDYNPVTRDQPILRLGPTPGDRS